MLVGANHNVKTALVKSSVSSYVPDAYIDTLGAKVSKKTMSVPVPRMTDPVSLDMMVWDISASRNMPWTLVGEHLRGARGIFAVCDATNPETMNETEKWIQDVLNHVGTKPVVLVAAVPDAGTGPAVTLEQLQTVAQKYGADFLFSQMGTGESTDRAFRLLAERITRSMFGSRSLPPAWTRGPRASPT